MRGKLFGVTGRVLEVLADLGLDDIALKRRQRTTAGERHLHHHDGGGFARIINQVEAALTRLVLESETARRIGNGLGNVHGHIQPAFGHLEPPDPEADGGEDCDEAEEDVHGDRITPDVKRRHGNRLNAVRSSAPERKSRARLRRRGFRLGSGTGYCVPPAFAAVWACVRT